MEQVQEEQLVNQRTQRKLEEQREDISFLAQKEQQLYHETISYAEEEERGYFQEYLDESHWLSSKIDVQLSEKEEALQAEYRNLIVKEEELHFQRQKVWQKEEENGS